MICTLCEDSGWMCESRPQMPWEGKDACQCGAAGMPCPWCNKPAEGDQPRRPEGFKIELDKDGWRH